MIVCIDARWVVSRRFDMPKALRRPFRRIVRRPVRRPVRCPVRCPVRRLSVALLAVACTLASGARAQRGAGDGRPWLEAETAHARLYAQTSPERALEIARSLELFRATFELLAPGIELASPIPTEIFAFESQESFAPYRVVAESRGTRVMGQMVAHRDGNYILLDAAAPAQGSMSVVFHEYVHYLVRHNFPRVPRWFNEGLAEYYSSFAIDADDVVLGRPVARHLRWLAQQELDLAEVFDRPLEVRGRHVTGEVGNFYAGSWALVHYLLSGDDERAQRMGELIARLSDGEDLRDALAESFGLRVSDLQREVAQYVTRGEFATARVGLESLRGRQRSIDLARPAPGLVEAALGRMSEHIGLPELAQLHAENAIAEGAPEGYGVLARLRDQQARFDEADALYRDAVSGRTRFASTYLDYARHLLQSRTRTDDERARTVDRARAALRHAEQIEPSFAEIDAVLGFSYLLERGDEIDAGTAALDRARRELPHRMDLVLYQAQLWMKVARFGEAETLIERTLVPYADPELVAQAREELERRRLVHEANEALAEGDTELGIELLDRAISVTSDASLREEMEFQLLDLQRRANVR